MGKAEALVELIKANNKNLIRDQIYVSTDERGVVIADNYDNPMAVAIIVTIEGGYLIHNCVSGRAVHCSESDAQYCATNFTNVTACQNRYYDLEEINERAY